MESPEILETKEFPGILILDKGDEGYKGDEGDKGDKGDEGVEGGEDGGRARRGRRLPPTLPCSKLHSSKGSIPFGARDA